VLTGVVEIGALAKGVKGRPIEKVKIASPCSPLPFRNFTDAPTAAALDFG
jgi:hypothetical protein